MNSRLFLRTTYLAGFLFSFHVALTVYINSSFLATKIPESIIGGLYAAAAIISIIGLFAVPQLIARFGSKKILGILLVWNMGNILGLVLSQNMLVTIFCFVFFFGINSVIYLGLDILIEQWSDIHKQGTVRGTYLTALNIGFMFSPLLAGYIADRLGFNVLYGVALCIMVPIFVLLSIKLPNVSEPHSSKMHILPLVQKFLRNKNLRGIFAVNTLLQFFYIWMTIYCPLYLHEYIHIGWDKIGLMFTVMLSAFVLFDYINGKLADTFHCEKLMIIIGLTIMGIATMYITRAPLMSFWALTFILFMTRVGASIVEVMTESYFFKHVHPDDVGSIGFFRNTFPFATIIASLCGSLLLLWIPFWSLFIILGSLCCIGAMLMIMKKRTY